MKRTIRIKRWLPYNTEDVWNAVTNAKMLGSWFMENDLEPVINHEFTFRKPPQRGWDGMTYCKVIAVEPMRYIAFTYRGKASGEKTLACAGIQSETANKSVKGIFTELDTVLSFTLTGDGNGTSLLLEHSGYKGLKLVIVSFVMGMGWKKLMKKLAAVLEKGNN